MFQEQVGSTFDSINAAIPYNITLCSSSKGIAQSRVLFELKDTTLTFVSQELTTQKPSQESTYCNLQKDISLYLL
jgi:hypothetical protein